MKTPLNGTGPTPRPEPYQVLDQRLQLPLGLSDSILLPYDGDQVLVLVLSGWEDDAGTRAVAHLADLATPLANEELVVLWLGSDVHGEALGLLQKPPPVCEHHCNLGHGAMSRALSSMGTHQMDGTRGLLQSHRKTAGQPGIDWDPGPAT